jgi:hypothetical protein
VVSSAGERAAWGIGWTSWHLRLFCGEESMLHLHKR